MPTSSGRASKPPGMGAISMLAAIVILVPGLLFYSLLRALGLGIGGAGLLGLLVMIISLGCYPVILKRTGWVGASRPSTPPPPGADPHGPEA